MSQPVQITDSARERLPGVWCFYSVTTARSTSNFAARRAGHTAENIAQQVERRGFDYVAVQDHPDQRRYLDTWTLLGVIAGATSRVGLFPDVANLPLRPPAVLAKAAASLDVVSGGRVELGLGGGGFWDAIAAYGGPRRAPASALGALEEAITVIRKVCSGERNLRFDGRHYHLAGAQSGPVPAHPMGIWLGVYGPRALAWRDGWPMAGFARLPATWERWPTRPAASTTPRPRRPAIPVGSAGSST